MKINILIGVIFVMLVSAIVYAEKAEDATQATDKSISKNMTYGNCVSQNADIKNTCYASVKDALATCKAQAPQDAAKKDAVKQCSQTYKKDKKQCKVAFKDSKKECAKIKHNFLETLGSSLK